jgi:hypothetical protein
MTAVLNDKKGEDMERGTWRLGLLLLVAAFMLVPMLVGEVLAGFTAGPEEQHKSK